MDHLQVIKSRLLALVTFPMFALSLLAGEQAEELRNSLPTLKQADMPKFLDDVWSLQDYELLDHVLNESDRDFLRHLRIKLGNADSDDFRNKVVVMALRGPKGFWEDDPPSSGSGSIDFAMRRVVLETLVQNLKEESVKFDDLDDERQRNVLADKLERALGGDIPLNPQEKNQKTDRDSSLSTSYEQTSNPAKSDKANPQSPASDGQRPSFFWSILGAVGGLAVVIGGCLVIKNKK